MIGRPVAASSVKLVGVGSAPGNASLDIRQRLDKSQGVLVPIDDILIAELRKHLTGKGYRRPREITVFHTQPNARTLVLLLQHLSLPFYNYDSFDPLSMY